ncbi:MAG: hypothetical protein H7248_07500 [Microbacteriaceae bacterium]|nr:hypothetical protein [Microbacteriaceae bacterium]
MTVVTVVQLYPGELGVAGDRGNVLALVARLRAAGFTPTVHEHRRDGLLPETADVVIVGGGPLSAMRNIYGDLMANAATLRVWAASGVPFFAYGSGCELLGTSVTLPDGNVLDGVGIFPLTAVRVPERTVGYVVVESTTGRVVGFEDNASRWTLGADALPLGSVSAGHGNGNGFEGVLAGRSIGTQIGGPVLPLNPALADRLVVGVAERLGIELTPREAAASNTTLTDDYAQRAREVIVGKATHVFSRI